MDNIWWINRLNLSEETIMSYVGDHYFKHLLFVKLMSGSGLEESDVKCCEFTMLGEDSLEFKVKLKNSKQIDDVVDSIEDSLVNMNYSIRNEKKMVVVTITSDGKELYSSGFTSNSYA